MQCETKVTSWYGRWGKRVRERTVEKEAAARTQRARIRWILLLMLCCALFQTVKTMKVQAGTTIRKTPETLGCGLKLWFLAWKT